MPHKQTLIRYFISAFLFGFAGIALSSPASTEPPRIVNIINFIRGVEPRGPVDLVEPVREQLHLAKKYKLPSTYLFQYDALITPEFVGLLKKDMQPGDEVGVWLEVVQPQVEAAGLKWRGRFPWDWHSDVGFTIGYMPDERRKLMDVLMAKFKEVFGHYPKSVGCWLIDAPTLNYLAEKYGIAAVCICKDQSGTDGYNLWGGYWNQAYYPSRSNAFVPAQTDAEQVNVPIFRMLGSDPVDQYDDGLGNARQGVISLEPVYPQSGGNPDWVRWFFNVNFDEPCLAFAYAQAGQENSFGWSAMKQGLEDQYPLLARLRDEGKIRVETLAESGEWFRRTFDHTPATAVVAPTAFRDENRGSFWYESRFYRLNFYSEGDSWRIRDIHLFEEKYPERYLDTRVETNDAFYDTLPIMNGHHWSSPNVEMAGIRLVALNPDGTDGEVLKTEKPIAREIGGDTLLITTPLRDGGEFGILCRPDGVQFAIKGTPKKWALRMSWSPEKTTSITDIGTHVIRYRHNDFDYRAEFPDADVSRSDNVIMIRPAANGITMQFD